MSKIHTCVSFSGSKGKNDNAEYELYQTLWYAVGGLDMSKIETAIEKIRNAEGSNNISETHDVVVKFFPNVNLTRQVGKFLSPSNLNIVMNINPRKHQTLINHAIWNYGNALKTKKELEIRRQTQLRLLEKHETQKTTFIKEKERNKIEDERKKIITELYKIKVEKDIIVSKYQKTENDILNIIKLLVKNGVYVNSYVNNPFIQSFKSSVKLARDYEFNTIVKYLSSKGAIDIDGNGKIIMGQTKMSPIFAETEDIKKKIEKILGVDKAHIVVKVGDFKRIAPKRKFLL